MLVTFSRELSTRRSDSTLVFRALQKVARHRFLARCPVPCPPRVARVRGAVGGGTNRRDVTLASPPPSLPPSGRARSRAPRRRESDEQPRRAARAAQGVRRLDRRDLVGPGRLRPRRGRERGQEQVRRRRRLVGAVHRQVGHGRGRPRQRGRDVLPQLARAGALRDPGGSATARSIKCFLVRELENEGYGRGWMGVILRSLFFDTASRGLPPSLPNATNRRIDRARRAAPLPRSLVFPPASSGAPSTRGATTPRRPATRRRACRASFSGSSRCCRRAPPSSSTD